MQATKRLRPALWAAIVLMAFSAAGCRGPEDAWGRIAESGVLRVGIDPTFPPFALDQGGVLTGIDVDLARALAEEMGLEVQFTYFGFDGLYDALTTGQVDVLISALVIAPERTEDVAYSAPYFDAGLILVVPKSGGGIHGMDDLDGQAVGVELGSAGHVEAMAWQRRLPSLTIETYDSGDEALSGVAAGETAAALVDVVGGRLFLRDHTDTAQRLTYVTQPVRPEPYALAVRIADRQLLRELNRALAQLAADGTHRMIIEAYLGPQVEDGL